jgi:hypothetical protein
MGKWQSDCIRSGNELLDHQEYNAATVQKLLIQHFRAARDLVPSSFHAEPVAATGVPRRVVSCEHG